MACSEASANLVSSIFSPCAFFSFFDGSRLIVRTLPSSPCVHVWNRILPSKRGSVEFTCSCRTWATRISSEMPSCRPHTSRCVSSASSSLNRSFTVRRPLVPHDSRSMANCCSHSLHSTSSANEPFFLVSFRSEPSNKYRWIWGHSSQLQAWMYFSLRSPSFPGSAYSKVLKSTPGRPLQIISTVYKWYIVSSPGKLFDISTSIVWSMKCSCSTFSGHT
mmetsp:Transcript_44715/g.116294  ORF Transcript_44715/g.116294 Transcript_44715/m.116294 type:complete len:219 (-) Transcript_44715:105-761(-)